MEILYLFAFIAGLIDAVVGGGGLVQLPALFLFLPEPLASVPTIFGTNKFAAIWGTGTATYQYQCRVRVPWALIVPAGVTAFLFSFLGARTVVLIEPTRLKPVIFSLLVLVAIYTYMRKDFGSLHVPRLSRTGERWFAILTGMAIGFYDGFFGPGTGSFLIFIFVGLFGFDFLTSSASAKSINFTTNLAAVSYFAATGHILYRIAVPMALCSMAGAIVGARLAIWKGNAFVRLFFLAIVAAMILRLGYDMFII